jgi:Domain of unknown function (DUF4333)
VLAVLAALPFLAFAGCSAEVSVGGDSSEASGEEIADKIKPDYERKTGIALTRLTCESVKGEEGARFECSGRNARGVQLEIGGRVTDTEAGEFDFHWEVTKAVAPGVLYERALRAEIEEQGVALSQVTCPIEIEVEVGARVFCKATDASGATRTVMLTLTDLDGGFEFAVADGVEEPPSEEPPAGASGEASSS